MKNELVKAVEEKTYHIVKFFQLRSLSLPTSFEREIQNTEVKGQDIQTATAEILRENVKFATAFQVAESATNETMQRAYANANKTFEEARAIQSTIIEVVKQQATAFSWMKANLTSGQNVWGTPEIINYMKINLIKDYAGDAQIALQLDTTK